MEINIKKKEIVNAFLNSIIIKTGIVKTLILGHSEFKLFDSVSCAKNNIFNYSEGAPTSGKWELILADLPIGMKADLNGRQVPYILKTINDSIEFLSESGMYISLGEPLLMRDDAKGIRALLASKGCSLVGIINAPEGLLRPFTELRPPFFIFKKGNFSKEFIGELADVDQARQLANVFIDNAPGENIEQGLFIDKGGFDGFARWKVRQQIQALETEYKQFNTKRFGDLLKSINHVKPKAIFNPLPNSLYIHKVGSKAVVAGLEKLTSGHSNYYQCECNENLVDAEYLESFFNSKLGKLILNSLDSGSYIPSISLQSLNDVEVSIPPLQAQKQIAKSISKLRMVREIIGQFEDDLALNPIGSDQTLKQIDNMLDVVGGLADSDKVMSLIRGGESKQTEFKESLTLDVKKQTKEKYIELSAIKTIAAFMNSASGTLIIGVNDAGEIHGVDQEISKFYKTHDDFLLKFRNLLKERIGGQAYDFIDYRLIKIGDKHVLLVECKESPIPIYVDDNDFYVRTNPATDKLDGPKMVTYITNHFSKKSEYQ